MGFRTVVVNSRCKLECRLNFLVVRGEVERKIFINEINTLIVQSTAVSLTAALLCELTKNNVKVIFCDEKCSPQTELIPYYGAHNVSKKIKEQFLWKQATKDIVWKRIIERKNILQAQLLEFLGCLTQSTMLLDYVSELEPGDRTNREGHAAKVYFNCILPKGVSRKDGGFLNGCLNYGYSVLLSAFNREIVASGYLTQLGIWHNNEFNQFNFSSDLMEPLRPFVDAIALTVEQNDKSFKKKMADVLNKRVKIDGKYTTLDLAVRIYVKSIINALAENDERLILFPEINFIEYER